MYENQSANGRSASPVSRNVRSRRPGRSWMPAGMQFPSHVDATVHWRRQGQPNRWRPAEYLDVRLP
jgi:hypothetical protein